MDPRTLIEAAFDEIDRGNLVRGGWILREAVVELEAPPVPAEAPMTLTRDQLDKMSDHELREVVSGEATTEVSTPSPSAKYWRDLYEKAKEEIDRLEVLVAKNGKWTQKEIMEAALGAGADPKVTSRIIGGLFGAFEEATPAERSWTVPKLKEAWDRHEFSPQMFQGFIETLLELPR